ncbi:MAG: hypothetical protein ACKVYV_01730 [Limisphaerales bacterium]
MNPPELILPAAVVARLRELLAAAPASELRGHREDLPGGFTKPEAIRSHLAGMLGRPDRWPEWLPEMLGPHLPGGALVQMTCETALPLLQLHLPEAVGEVAWAAALVLDGRPGARRLLDDLLARPDFGREPTEDGRLRYAEYVLGSFLTAVLPDWKPAQPDAAAVPENAEGGGQELERLRAENARLKAAADNPNEHQRRRLRDSEDRLRGEFATERRALDEQVSDLSTQVGKLVLARDAAAGGLAAARTEAERLSAELARARAAVGEEVERRLADAQFAWLRAAHETEQRSNSAAAATDELLAGVEAVLTRQAEQDRHAGNRRRMREDLARLEAAVTRIEAAQADALLPLPQLAALRDALLAHIAKNRRTLGVADDAPSPAVRALRSATSRANAAEDFGRLTALRRELWGLGLLSDAEAAALDAELEPRHAAFLVSGVRRESVRAGLLRGLREGRPLLVFVDGYNVTKLLPGLVPDGASLPGARRRLNDAVEALVGRHPGLRATVVYDSPEAAVQEVCPRFTLEFSGGGHGPDRADRRIQELLDAQLAADPNLGCWVVSNDNAVRRDALRWAATFLRLDDFGVWLRDEGILI